MRKAFKSSVVFDQQVVSRDTMPTAMLETYHQCDTPPPLDKLNVYRYFSLFNYINIQLEFEVIFMKHNFQNYLRSNLKFIKFN